MNFESIFAEWEKDSNIERTSLDTESIKIPELHHKYYKIYIAEKVRLRKLESEMKKLKLDKYEFYTQGHNEETRAKGWILPSRGAIIKADVQLYLDADTDIIDLSLQIGIQQEKIDFLESIIKSLRDRGFLIKTALDFIKFTNGT